MKICMIVYLYCIVFNEKICDNINIIILLVKLSEREDCDNWLFYFIFQLTYVSTFFSLISRKKGPRFK